MKPGTEASIETTETSPYPWARITTSWQSKFNLPRPIKKRKKLTSEKPLMALTYLNSNSQ
jgi:hypothetical protein